MAYICPCKRTATGECSCAKKPKKVKGEITQEELDAIFEAGSMLMISAMNRKTFYNVSQKPKIRISGEKLKQVYNLWSKEAEFEDEKENIDPADDKEKEDQELKNLTKTENGSLLQDQKLEPNK